ncbi:MULTISPECIES: energy-coupling factor ABC transporter permease [Vibrio diabolicus subgroup]|uniref:energy-coupling factor ABC transporter permease n=1 Tax=Vibrio diabolicus subgroup TaxID=2315253 RepID=UPI0018F8C7CA|nr:MULTISPECIES: energy-coupling factor ABC transporter permease [Vibrio diabolicus subgroup]MCE9829270.1 energy-coupling factor ABC transporter permease [Vibrio diabolicus]MCG9622960.1 energy-coupling factor ABC transporter permease [Vibrio diabolicus]MCR9474385.1 energy-coupling factor ABC transporter permease [Vibrio diabolicus]MCR9989354.1 energy-coupling factor ABC transporter permease [Vibrio antiquarius]NTU36044.1 energy-coupling factor ABC transporter permease [Vibrio diabolicus]
MDWFNLGSLVVILWTVLAYCLPDWKKVVWPKLEKEKAFQHLVFATLFFFSILWATQAGVKEGLQIHFLALTTLTMMYGWRMAFLISIPAMLVNHLLHDVSLLQLPTSLVLSALLPIFISYLVFLLSYHYLPRNIFVFIFVAGFFNGAITGSLHLLINSFYHLSVGHYDWETIQHNYFIFVPLLAFPEGLLNGMSLAVLTVFKPEWLRVFSDRDYIYNHYHK